MTTVPLSPTTVGPRWRTLGGGTILVAAVLLLVATLLEYIALPHPGTHDGVFWLFFVALGLSAILFLLAMIPLAFGARGSDGIVGNSVLGKVGLVAFGVLWLVGQVLYLVGTYFVSSAGGSSLLTVSTILTVVSLVGALVAAILILLRHVATGAARWSLILAVVVSVVTGALAGGPASVGLITIMHGISALGLIFVGISYLLSRPATK